jgi:hypothetical protein|uniref:Uncharacterized protein n=1 Tax=viral metagenome TaxID=1070528 RepID=A0A6C0CFN1_9ZZZZ
MNLDLKNQFVEDLDNIYRTHLIYRTIVVCDKDIVDYKELLENKDFSVYVVNTVSNINYDTLDHRIILVNNKILEDFLNSIIANDIDNFYTYISFTYDNTSMKEAIVKKYHNVCDIVNNIL